MDFVIFEQDEREKLGFSPEVIRTCPGREGIDEMGTVPIFKPNQDKPRRGGKRSMPRRRMARRKLVFALLSVVDGLFYIGQDHTKNGSDTMTKGGGKNCL